MMAPITFDWPWSRRPTPEPPAPIAPAPAPDRTLLEQVAALQRGQEYEQRERALLAQKNEQLRDQVIEVRSYADSLNRVTERQQTMLMEQGELITTLRTQLDEANDARHYQRRVLDELRTQVSSQQAEIKVLQTQLREVTDDRDYQIQRRQAIQLAFDEVKQQRDRAEARLRAHGIPLDSPLPATEPTG